MGKLKDEIEEKEHPHEYKFNAAIHAHTYCDKPLLGTSTVVGIISKPLTWWAAGLAVAKLGWINSKTMVAGKYKTTPLDERLALAGEALHKIRGMDTQEYLNLLDEAYSAHSMKLNSSAKEGTDLHAELERFIKFCINVGIPVPDTHDAEMFDSKIKPFIEWTYLNVEKFLWSEIHCYSNELWVGGISDCGVLLKNGKIGIIDFKSSKDSYESQFIQCAGYDIQIQENGGFTDNGYKTFELDKPIEFYAIVPFGAPQFTIDFRYNVDELKEGFKAAVVLYKLNNK